MGSLGKFGDVMVIGGGISGIQAALDLATAGYRVLLVEKSPTIGGKMAQLDKTFPTNDCSMCIESPKFVECNRHPNIEILTYTEVARVDGQAGDFRVTLVKKPRYVVESRCTGCTVCVEYCPSQYPDPFNQELSLNKAIHIYFAQAIPLVTYIDDSCLYLRERKCAICREVCKNDAIDFSQTAETIDAHVGAIILAIGYEPFDPRRTGDYGCGTLSNVVTSLDFERLMCATGPHEGEILRPSDKRHPRRVAWIHCVGSRRVQPGYQSYCSAVCCTYTQKQVILTKDHDAETECTIFHNDIRAYGKDFERFHQRAANLPGVRFIRSFVSLVAEDPVTKSITLRYATADQGTREEEFDLVVLSVGLSPPPDARELAEKLGVALDARGFCLGNPLNPIRSSRPGIFISGACKGPMDIPESVVTASAAGAQCAALLNRRRGKLARKRVYPPEREVSAEEPRVAVFVCHCGANIGRVIDVPSAVDYSRSLPHVVHAEENLFICSTEAAKQIADTIRQRNINRVVVAACTPRTHEPLFRDTLREGGINQYFFDMANIREHCSWVHSREKEEATRKAKDLIRMSVARTLRLEPLREFELPVTKAALVVGGGVAGLTSALAIAQQGYAVFLVEKEPELGGLARRLHYTLEGLDVPSFLADLVRRVYRHPLIRVYTDAAIVESSGYVGNFVTRIQARGAATEIRHGTVVIATGAEEYRPTEYLYGQEDRVWTQLELEERIARRDPRVSDARCVVMIQCVGCRQEDRNYCARICCSQAVKNALKLKEMHPGVHIYILFRDMRTYGFREDHYRQAAENEVQFLRYEPPDKPHVEPVAEDGRRFLRVALLDAILGKRLAIDADLLVLSAAVLPPAANAEIARWFKLTVGPDGFFQEAHVKLRSVDFAAEGIFLCGTAHYPKHLSETISQAYGAAGRALTLLANDTVTASGSVCDVAAPRCIGCGACIEACRYGAIAFTDTRQGPKATVNPVLCKGDGLCNAKCPTGAIMLRHYTDEQVVHQIEAALTDA